MAEDGFFTFAYGSNMSTKRLLARCPSAVKVGIGQLFGYELRWNKPSSDGSGKCNIVKSVDTNSCVYGVVFQISSSEKAKLDKAEGLGKGYSESEIEVALNGSTKKVSAYLADKTDDALCPYSWYWDFVLSGARENCLPESYICQLLRQEFVKDGNVARHQEQVDILLSSKP
jgi:cation transport regulator ChaC